MRNQSVILVSAISLLLMAVVFIFVSQIYIPNERKKITDELKGQYALQSVFIAKDEIAKGISISQQLFDQGTIAIENIPTTFIAKDEGQALVYANSEYTGGNADSITSTIIGKEALRDIGKGEILTYTSFDSTKVLQPDHALKQVMVSVKNDAGDVLKTGKYVDIVVKYLNGDYDIVVPKILVDKVVVTKGTSEDPAQQAEALKTPEILIAVNEVQYRDLEIAKRLGELSIRMYTSPKQYPALQTFNYNKIVETIKNLNNAGEQKDAEGDAEPVRGSVEDYYERIFLGFDSQQKVNIEAAFNQHIKNEQAKIDAEEAREEAERKLKKEQMENANKEDEEDIESTEDTEDLADEEDTSLEKFSDKTDVAQKPAS